MPDINTVRTFLADETGLATISTTQKDGRVLSSVANCGVISHPTTGEDCVALVSRGPAARLGHVRRGSEVTVAARRGWSWVAVTGPAELIGPNDSGSGMEPDAIRVLLRDIFTAAGGTHDDWEEYDRVMAEDERTAMLVAPQRILGQAPTE